MGENKKIMAEVQLLTLTLSCPAALCAGIEPTAFTVPLFAAAVLVGVLVSATAFLFPGIPVVVSGSSEGSPLRLHEVTTEPLFDNKPPSPVEPSAPAAVVCTRAGTHGRFPRLSAAGWKIAPASENLSPEDHAQPSVLTTRAGTHGRFTRLSAAGWKIAPVWGSSRRTPPPPPTLCLNQTPALALS